MSNENTAKIKLTLPKNPYNHYYGAKVEIDGKELVIFDYKIESGNPYWKPEKEPRLVLTISPECYEIILEETEPLLEKEVKPKGENL